MPPVVIGEHASFAPLIIGHRGAPGYRPEHTRASYELALAQGADAVEPDVVPSRDGVLLVRHENELSGTTDVASRPAFRHLRTTKEVNGRVVTGWFTEDFTWAQLSTLRAVERLPALRSGSAAFDGVFPLLRLADVLALVRRSKRANAPGLVVELKHAGYFESIGLPLDELLQMELAQDARTGPAPDLLVVESFERPVLAALQRRKVPARYVHLLGDRRLEHDAADTGVHAWTFAEDLSDEHLAAMRPAPLQDHSTAPLLDGISVSKAAILEPTGAGHHDLVARAHAAGLEVYCWTFRPENDFLAPRHRRGLPGVLGNWRSELEELVASGVDGVFVDHPDLARRGRDRALVDA